MEDPGLVRGDGRRRVRTRVRGLSGSPGRGRTRLGEPGHRGWCPVHGRGWIGSQENEAPFLRLLMFVVAPLVAVGAPITLLMAAVSPGVHDRLVRQLNSAVLPVLSDPE